MQADSTQSPTVGYIVSGWPRLSETFVLNEVLAVERSGGSLRIFSIKDPDGEPVHARVAQVRAPVTCLSLRRHWKSALQANLRLLCRQPGRYCRALLQALRYRRRGVLLCFFQAGYLAHELSREPVAHLHAHFAHAPAPVAMFTHQLTGIPYTFTAHAKDIYIKTPPELLRAEAQQAQAVITCTEYNRQYLSTQIGPASDGKLHCIYHGLDASQFQFAGPRVAGDGDRDGIPNVLLEAMGSGVPVVSTPVSGIPELIESERDGLLVPPSNPARLADALDRLLTSPELRERLGRAAQAKIEAHFSIDRSSTQLLALFQRGRGQGNTDWEVKGDVDLESR